MGDRRARRSLRAAARLEPPALTLRYRQLGTPRNPCLLLLHGLGAHAGWWQPVAERLADRFHVVAPDLRGHGRSPWARDGDYRAGAHARDLLALLGMLRVPRVIVVGHSLGSSVALALARVHPWRVAGLAGLDPPLACPPRLLGRLHEIASLEPVVFASLAQAVRSFRPVPREHAASPARLKRIAVESFRPPHGERTGWTSRTDRAVYQLQPADAEVAALAQLELPVAFLCGGRSPVTGRQARERLRHSAPWVDVDTVPGAGHQLPLDAPEATADWIAGFAERVLRSALARRAA